jgi:Na+/proline symporter
MQLQIVDWLIVLLYFALSMFIGFWFAKRASQDMQSYFVSGRSLPWWLAGTSMVATTFSSDTPLLVTNLTRSKGGVSGNWEWWAFVIGGMLTVFFFARLWRRSGVLTDVEFYEIRYSGKPATVLRGFRAIYSGILYNIVIIGSVTMAIGKSGHALLGWPNWVVIVVCCGTTLLYCITSGLWGVVVTDLFQFIIAMTGSVAVAYFAVRQPQVGGLDGLLTQLPSSILSFLPDWSSGWSVISPFLVLIAVQWWASVYPGAEPGGGGYVAQRMFASKDEKHSLAATLWFQVAHYAVRPWPWIIAALSSLILFPVLPDPDLGYVLLFQYLPAGFVGIVAASLIAAFMSTISTHLNWGASYLVNDLYKRLMVKGATPGHYVTASRLATVLIMVLTALLAIFFFKHTQDAFNILLTMGAGSGLVFILRWFWWRVNAWSEISAMVVSFTLSNVFRWVVYPDHDVFNQHKTIVLFYTTVLTTLAWITVTFLTRPTSRDVLKRFYTLVRPAGPFWAPITAEMPEVRIDDSITWSLLAMILGMLLVYTALFGTGYVLYGHVILGVVFLAIAAASAACIISLIGRVRFH